MSKQIPLEDVLAVVPDPAAVPVSDAQRWELDARLADHRANPDDGAPWDEVKARLQRER